MFSALCLNNVFGVTDPVAPLDVVSLLRSLGFVFQEAATLLHDAHFSRT